MKCLLAFLLIAITGLAQNPNTFATGQAARVILGQTQFTRGEPGASQSLLGGVSGLAFAGDTLFVADSNRAGSLPINNRVLVFKNVSSQIPLPTDEWKYDQRCPVCVGAADLVLGQPDFTTTDYKKSQDGLRLPTAVASDGRYLAVADTDNNRVLIWNSLPTRNGQPADVVIGQENFTSNMVVNPPNAKSMRGPQGVWIQYGKLYVADTQNHRVLIWNNIPTSNGQPADVVLGQPDFTAFSEPDITQARVDAKATNMLNPVSVTSDGFKLFVADLGHNRVLIWNSIPTANQAPADVVIGQPDMTSAVANYSYTVDADNNPSKVLCDPTGEKDDDDKDIYPSRCERTLSFPRYVLSDGTRLFVADGGNDRVLIFNRIPTENAAAADYVLGQLGGQINQASDAADSMRTPMSIAWDGTNLYVSDAYNRRINVYSMALPNIPYSGVRNAASLEIYAVGSVAFSGTITKGDKVTITINEKDYAYTVKEDDTMEKVVTAFVELINAGDGDPNVLATPDLPIWTIILTARAPGSDGNEVEYSTTTGTTATIVATAGGSTLAGGMDAAKIAPGTLVTILGENLSDNIAEADLTQETLPENLGGVQVYFDGWRAPLVRVAPDRITAQVPYDFLDTTSINCYVRTQRNDGGVTVTTPVAITVVAQNPGIFAVEGGKDPRPGRLVHSSSYATGTISVDGTATAGEVAKVTIEDRTYSYTVQDGDTIASVARGLIAVINQDPKVMAYEAGMTFTSTFRIRLRARVPGPEGNGIPFSGTGADSGNVIITATNSALCCANTAGAPVTEENPAMPGETLIAYATGLGLPDPQDNVRTGQIYPLDGGTNQPKEFVSALAGGKTANVLFAGLQPGTVGIWRVDLELNSDMPTNPLTQMTIAQAEYVSNIITFPLVNPNPSDDTETDTATAVRRPMRK